MTSRAPAARPSLRCAIYTRKSSEEGLGQEFNSLDAQHEACAAYVASQKHEGWKLAPERYDDGGLSGGTLERPALQRLLADIDAGRIKMVVVYKIDRLTRSLADFAKLVERLEGAGCSFVSVTQAFNTSSSMGRLTLNVLLSFAQFEREVTAERIRDKIAASKRKGMWMGGTVPLGYDRHPDPQRRELVVNAAEAEVVRTLFRLYEELGCLRRVEEAAAEHGLRSKLRTTAGGSTSGGTRLSRGQIHYLLTNVTYRGLIRHKANAYPGQHPALIEEALWDRVQAKLQAAASEPRREWRRDGGGRPHDLATPGAPVGVGTPGSAGISSTFGSPLTGKLRDETGDRLTPTHTVKAGRRIRYYMSSRLAKGRSGRSHGSSSDRSGGWRLPAPALEAAVADAVASHLETAARTCSLLAQPRAAEAAAAADRARDLVGRLRADEWSGSSGHQDGRTLESGPNKAPDQKRDAALRGLVTEGRIGEGALHITLDPDVLAAELGTAPADLAPALLTVTAPFSLRRRGVELRLVAGSAQPSPDPKLLSALAKAHRWAAEMRQGLSLAQIAARERTSESYISSRTRLAFLSPAIQTAIVTGTQPTPLTLERIMRAGVPLDWQAQATLFGFAAD